MGLGSGYYTCRNLELPTSDPRQLEGMVGFQLDDISPFDIEDLALSWSRRGGERLADHRRNDGP